MGNIIDFPVKRKLKIDTKKNSIVVGDCIEWLKDIPANCVDICYIDPPFFSGQDYEKTIWGNGYELRSFTDRRKGGIKHYISWMHERVELIRKALKPTGCIFLHCDWHANYKLRAMLDSVFGEENFIEEITYLSNTKEKGNQHKDNALTKSTNTIYWYKKSNKFCIDPKKIREPFDVEEIKNKFPKEDSIGRYLRRPALRSESMGRRPNLCYKYKNYAPPPWGWRMKKEKLEARDKKGDLGWNSKGTPFIKNRPGNYEGKKFLNFWGKFSFGRGEKCDYKTQKPESLIEKILEMASSKNSLVLDCFGGGGTTAVVAAKLGRRFITGDVSPVAVRVMAERLSVLRPPLIPSIVNVPKTKEEWLNINGHDFAERICGFMGWECNPKKSGDGGIDGWANNKTVPIQIKNHRNKVGRPDIQKFVGALVKSGEGIFVAWDFTNAAWDYKEEVKEEDGKTIQFIKVDDILGDILIDSDKKMELESLYKERKCSFEAA